MCPLCSLGTVLPNLPWLNRSTNERWQWHVLDTKLKYTIYIYIYLLCGGPISFRLL